MFVLSIVFLLLSWPSDAQPCKSKSLKTCKLPALKALFSEGHSVRIFHVSDNKQIVLADWDSAAEAYLLILEKFEQKWQARFVCDDDLWGKSWMAIENVPKGNEKFTIVDHSVEGPGWELMVLFSNDMGESWQLRGCIKKPYYFALLESFEVQSSKDASVIMNLDDSPVPEIAAGRYQTTTRDGGRTWSTPSIQFTPADKSVEHSINGAASYSEMELLVQLP